MKINDRLHGFTVTNIRQSESGEFAELSHDKTAARLTWMNNGNENKLFSISFKTVPEDDTGVFHILEHSVLGGSENYPVKEPFLYLLKGSMNTFLNAMTFSDKTMFPVSSRNNTDFINLTKVYLDAVFKPMIYTVPEIFYQEGHHTEFFGNDEEAALKGVVFNEMKGYSNVHDRIENEMNAMLFPDTSYRFESGGTPKAIPDLTYEQFKEAHRRFYHPSNSYIYLDGDIDINTVLPIIDSYLSEYEKSNDLPELSYQKPVSGCEKELYYDSSSEDEEDAQTYLAVGKILASWQEREKIAAYSVILEAIAGCNDSPFKKDILDTELCLDVTLNVFDGILQPYGVLKFCNIDRENGEALLKAAEASVRRLVENGIGTDILEAALNRCEFRFRESEEPKGLVRCIDSMSSWLYDGDPLEYIEMTDVFAALREKLGSGYYEELLSEWLLEPSGRAVLYMLPSNTYCEEQAELERQFVSRSLSELNDDEREKLISLNQKLAQWQETPDTPEAIATLPILPLSEISTEPVEYPTEVCSENSITVLKHPVREREIAVMTLYFAVDDLTEEEFKLLSVIEPLIAELSTEKSTGLELQSRIIGTLGSLSTSISPIGTIGDIDSCKVFFCVKSRFLVRNLVSALELIGELLTETVYEDPEAARRLLRQDEEDMKQDIISDGHRFAIRRTRAALSASGSIMEFIGGFEGYNHLHSVNELSDEEFSKLLSRMKPLTKKIFCKSRLTASISSASELSLEALTRLLPKGEKPAVDKMSYRLDIPMEQGIIIPSATSHSGAALSENIEDKAVWSVLHSILSYEYLWNEVRVKGGAYGTGCGINELNEVTFHSYCDPTPVASTEIFAEAADFLREYCSAKPDITSYIISSIAASEPLMSDAEFAANADGIYFRGVTDDYRRKVFRDMLEMTAEKLLAACDDLEKPMYRCIVGSEEVISSVKTKEFEVSSVY